MSSLEKYTDLQADFYHYMVKFGGMAKNTSRDYVTRMRFLARDYSIDETLTKEKVDDILNQENLRCRERKVYSSKKSLSDFKSGLHKFLNFVHSDYHQRIADSIVREIKTVENDNTIKVTEKDAIVKSRIGQGMFRKRLIEYWHGCAISKCPLTWMLIASHIKPWQEAGNQERLDVYNGLLLLPNYDRLFDLGYISFTPKGKIMISHLLTKDDLKAVGLVDDLHLVKCEEQHSKYLRYHNENCFLS